MIALKPTRAERRQLQARERQLKGKPWAPWVHHRFPKGSVGGAGWTAQIGEAWSNGYYAVLLRALPGGVLHLAIRTAGSAESPWRDLQRIKNELAGPERFAVQVYPLQSRLIDEADMYHLWVMPQGFEPGYGLSDEERHD